MGRTSVMTSPPMTSPPLTSPLDSGILSPLSPPPCPRVTWCLCPLSSIPSPCCPCSLSLPVSSPSSSCLCPSTSVGASRPLSVPTASHVNGDVMSSHCSTVPDSGSSHCDGVRSHGAGSSCRDRLLCHCVPCVGNHPRDQYGCGGKSCDKLPDPSDNADVMNHVSGTNPLCCCVNNHRRPVNTLCHSVVSVQRDSDSVNNNIPERPNSRRHGVNNLSNPVNTTTCRNRVSKSFGGGFHDPSENDVSVKHHAGVCDQCDNVNNIRHLINSSRNSLVTTRDNLNSRSDCDSGSVSGGDGDGDSNSVANSLCCDVPITCSCDDDVSWHPASVSSRLSGTVIAERPHPLAFGKGVWELPESVARTARLIVEWCRAWLVLPAILVVLLLLLRRKGRRRGAIQGADVLLLLCLLLSHCVALPWVEEDNRSVKLRARFCQPVPEDHLRHMLGAAFIPHRMSSDDPLAGRRRRGDLSLDPGMEDAALDSYSVGDGAVGDAFVRDHEEEEEEEVEEEDWMNEEVAGRGRGRGRGGGGEVVKREDIMEEEEEEEEGQLYTREKTDGGSDQQKPSHTPTTHPPPPPPYHNMKRRRKRQAGQEDTGDASDIVLLPPMDKKKSSSRRRDDHPLLPLRLLLAGRNRNLRRKLKKEFRKKARRMGRITPPWTCSMSKSWGRLKEGFFPRYLLDGRCLSDRCFYRLYDCVPQGYRVKLLRRDPDYCNPLPTVGVNSTYEQRWTVVRYQVTVGCGCQSADPLRVSLPFQGQIRRP